MYLVLVVIVCPHVVSRVQSRGPFGGKITALDVTIGGTILAVSDSAIYRSEQEGYWELVTPDENKNTPECFLNYDRDIILAGTSRGVYRSTDDGKSWNALPHTLSFGRVNSLLAMSQKEIFLGTERGELYHSTDQGDHWFTITLPIRNESIAAFVTDAKGTLYVGTTKGHIFLSGDAGIQWRVREAPFIQYPLSTLSVSSDGKLLAGSRGGGIVRWNEKSSRWENISADFPFQLINKLITAQHDQIFALTDIGGILASTDAGDHWVSLGLLKHHLSVLSIDTRQRLLAGSEKGLFRSTKDRSWEPIGVPSVSISVLGSLNPGFLIAGSNEEGIFISTDDGISWIPSSKGLAGNDITAFAQISGKCLAIGVMPTPPQRTSGGIHISLDSGKTWIQTGLINVNVSSIISIGTVTIAGTDSGMYRSGNDWKIWKKLSPANGVQRITSMAASRSGVVFAGTR